MVNQEEDDVQPAIDFQSSASPFPWLAMLALCIGTLAHGVMFTAPLPFVAFMVVDFGMVDNLDQAGYWAGWITGFFMIGRCVVGIPWGLASDKYGRKICMLISMSSLCILGVLFGMSTSFIMAITVRLFIGFGNGFIGVAKTIISELCPKEHEVRGFGILNGIFGLGMIVGPMVGGLLSRPAIQYPATFSQDGLWGRFPYLLPCIVCASIACMAVVAISAWVPETLEVVEPLPCFFFCRREIQAPRPHEFELLPMESSHGFGSTNTGLERGEPNSVTATLFSPSANDDDESADDDRDKEQVHKVGTKVDATYSIRQPTEHEECDDSAIVEIRLEIEEEDGSNKQKDDYLAAEDDAPSARRKVSPMLALLKDKYILNILVVNIFYCFINMFVDEVFPLWGVSTLVEGGLAWDSAKVGSVLACIGGMLVLFQLVGYEAVVKHCCSEDCVITLFRFIMFGSVAICLLPVVPYLITSSQGGERASVPHVSATTAAAAPGDQTLGEISNGLFRVNATGGNMGKTVRASSSWVDAELAVVISVVTMVTFFKIAATAGFASLSILTNAAVDKDLRGTINGLVMTCGSFGNAMGPILGSAFYALAVDAPAPIEGRMVFVVAAIVFLLLGFAAKCALTKPTR